MAEVVYHVLQHIRNPMRKETRNVGLFVQAGTVLMAKFEGEDKDGKIDATALAHFLNPGIYTQWVEYFRWVMNSEGNPLEVIKSELRLNYQLFSGTVEIDGEEPLTDTLNRLFKLLVSWEEGDV